MTDKRRYLFDERSAARAYSNHARNCAIGSAAT